MNQFRKWKTLVALFFGVFVYAWWMLLICLGAAASFGVARRKSGGGQ